MAKRKPWMKLRHRIVTAIARPFLTLTAILKYHIKVDKFRAQGERNWLILSNHQTDFDQFFLGMAFRGPVYYVAMEDLFSMGFLSRLIQWAVAPIPIMKATNDVKAVMTCIRLAREGGTIGLFPEGNRTYSGTTCYIKPSVAALAKKLGLPIAIFRIEGGYGVKPRWADRVRGGKMRAGVRRVIEREEYAALSNDELYDLICKELWVDESAQTASFPSKYAAEHLERVFYVCPECGLSEFTSAGDTVRCKKCGAAYRYTENCRFENAPFPDPASWYRHQEEFIRQLDLSPYALSPMYRDSAEVREVIVYDRKRLLMKDAPITLCGDRLELGSGANRLLLPFDDIRAMACIAGHKLNVFYQDTIYQLKGGDSFNALKYCNIYYHAKYVKEGHTDGKFQFLGL